MEGRTVVVVGAGPAGSCAAMALANAGASVAVYEMRSEDTFVQDEGEPYAIVLEQRGLSALLNAGFLDADFHGSTYVSLSANLHAPNLSYTSIQNVFDIWHILNWQTRCSTCLQVLGFSKGRHRWVLCIVPSRVRCTRMREKGACRISQKACCS